jgi:hypothetical protein
MGQLRKCWPGDQGQTLLSNTSKIFFAVNELQTAQFLSQSLGQETIIVESEGSNNGWSRGGSKSSGASYSEGTNWGSSGGTSTNRAPQQRELLKPDEVMNLHPRTAITLTPGVRPVYTTLLRYYEEPAGVTGRRRTHAAPFRAFLTSLCLLAVGVLAAPLLTLDAMALIPAQSWPQSQPLNPPIAPPEGPPQDQQLAPATVGAQINWVAPGSTAHLAGLSRGDVILAVGRTKIQNIADLRQALQEAGRIARLVIRQGRTGQERVIYCYTRLGSLDILVEMVNLGGQGSGEAGQPTPGRASP